MVPPFAWSFSPPVARIARVGPRQDFGTPIAPSRCQEAIDVHFFPSRRPFQLSLPDRSQLDAGTRSDGEACACGRCWAPSLGTVVHLLHLATAYRDPPADEPLLPLFPRCSSTSAPPTLHTSLASLLPVLPALAPAPDHTLLVTLATPAFKPLLFNWLCFLRYKARWGQQATHNEHGERVEEPEEEDETPKVLVVTSDEELAYELSEQGVVVWWVAGPDWSEFDAAEDLAEDDPVKWELVEKVERAIMDDPFTNLRLLDLLLPSQPNPDDDATRVIPWGTLKYQSLMLERTAVMSTLIGALVESQKSMPLWRKEQDAIWRERILAHDWESGPIDVEGFKGVKGVLMVDNDAVWLSSPSAFISHYYRPTGPFPSIVYAPDMNPNTQNAWGKHTMPCACFFYSRVSDAGAQLAAPSSPSAHPADMYLYSPSTGAAKVWRDTALCHISMLLQALETGRKQSQWYRANGADCDGDPNSSSCNPQLYLSPSVGQLPKARAPSFQATALGPALFLAEQALPHLPELSHDRFMHALGSADVDDLNEILDEAGLSLDAYAGTPKGKTCLQLAQEYQSICPVSHDPSAHSSLTISYFDSFGPYATRPHTPIRIEPLPFDLFPPGMRFFDGGLEPGARPCVVHANYATGMKKEELLREKGLWALEWVGDETQGEWMCDARVMKDA